MAWRRPGDKPLSEPMMVSLLTHVCVARPQWVKQCAIDSRYMMAHYNTLLHSAWQWGRSIRYVLERYTIQHSNIRSNITERWSNLANDAPWARYTQSAQWPMQIRPTPVGFIVPWNSHYVWFLPSLQTFYKRGDTFSRYRYAEQAGRSHDLGRGSPTCYLQCTIGSH